MYDGVSQNEKNLVVSKLEYQIFVKPI